MKMTKEEKIKAWEQLAEVYGVINPISWKNLAVRHMVEVWVSKIFAQGSAQFYNARFEIIPSSQLVNSDIHFSLDGDNMTVHAGEYCKATFTITEDSPTPVFAAVRV